MYILYDERKNKYFTKRVGIRNYWSKKIKKACKIEDYSTAQLIAFQTLATIIEA